MIVQPLALQANLVQAATRVTRVSLADLLNGSGTDSKQQQALINLLRSMSSATARVIETRADGSSLLELGGARVALRLAGNPAPGESILISMDDLAASVPADGNGKPGIPAAARHLDTRADGAPIRERSAASGTTRLAGTSAAGALLPSVMNDAAEPLAQLSAEPGVKLSPLARLLHGILNSDINQTVTKTTTTEPLITKATSTPELAQTLKHAVRTSGLFYESHLQGWVDGRIPLKEIFEEPQARIADATPVRTGEAREAVHPQLEHLVRQQLDTFERQTIAWRGFVWPDQQADIVIEGAPQPADKDAGERTWRVHLKLDTPTLGPVAADIALVGRRLAVRLQGEAVAAPALRNASADLARALCAHDLDVNGIQVAGDHKAP